MKICIVSLFLIISLDALKLNPEEGVKTETKKGVLILSRASDLGKLSKSLHVLQSCSWLTHHPVYVMVTERLSPQRVEEIHHLWSNVTFLDIQEKGLWTPSGENARFAGRNSFKGGMPWGRKYRQMCDLWATKIPSLATELGLDYYLRLDSDSVLKCTSETNKQFFATTQELSEFATAIDLKSGTDMFDVMEKGKYRYAYYHLQRDAVYVSQGIHDFVQGYVTNHSLNINDTLAAPHLWKEGSKERRDKRGKETSGSLSFYNNMEIVDVKYFKRPDVVAFTKAVSDSGGIYDYRWGDAIIRYWQVALFSKSEDTLCLSGQFGTQYQHGSMKGEKGACLPKITAENH